MLVRVVVLACPVVNLAARMTALDLDRGVPYVEASAEPAFEVPDHMLSVRRIYVQYKCAFGISFGLRLLLHALTHIPMYESSLTIHQIEFMIQPTPRLGNGRRIAQHTH